MTQLDAEIKAIQRIVAKEASKPAQFRRITARTKITVPCVMALWDGERWWIKAIYVASDAERLLGRYTHWLPFQWPGVR